MLPKLNPNGGRGLPGLRLLRDVSDADEQAPLARGRRGQRSEEDERTPKAQARRSQGFGNQVVVADEMTTPVARARKSQIAGEGSTLPKVSNRFQIFEDADLSEAPRGRGLLRPVGNDVRIPLTRSPSIAELQEAPRGRALLRPIGNEVRLPVVRSKSPLPRERSGIRSTEEHSYMPHNEARQRVRHHNRQSRRKAKEEEDRCAQEERERHERTQRALPQLQSHRREIGRKAHEILRREVAEKEAAQRERGELASARQDRISRYMTPDRISETRRHSRGSRGFSSQVSQDSGSVRPDEHPGRTAEAGDAKTQWAAEAASVDDHDMLG